MKPLPTIIFACMLLAMLSPVFARPPADKGGDADAVETDRHAIRQKLVKASESPKFQAAIKQLQKLTGAEPKPLETAAESDPTGGVWFDVTHKKADELLAAQRKTFLAQGAYLFRCQNAHGLSIGGVEGHDQIALLPTTNGYEVLAAIETEGPNSNVYGPDLMKWLKDLDKTQPFEITEAGTSFLVAKFKAPVKDPTALAAKILKLCPDYDSGEGPEASLKKIQEDLKKGNLFLFWT